MSRFKHPHVMGLIGVCLDAGIAPYIIMPYMANGCLLDYLKRERGNLVLAEKADDDQVCYSATIRVPSMCMYFYIAPKRLELDTSTI